MKDNLSENTLTDDEVSVKDMLIKIRAYKSYFYTKWLTILIYIVLGGLFGAFYSIYKKPVYTATTTFVLDDGGKSGGSLGQYSDLASMAGINIGGGQGGLFQSENIIALYKSRTMIKKTLMAKRRFDDNDMLIIERYIQFNGLRDKWSSKPKLKNINFTGDPNSFSRLQDSIITDIYEKINEKNLTVVAPDKKSSIIVVKVESKDELFSKLFAETLVENVNTFYIQTKISRSLENFNVLKHQADSVRAMLNSSMSGVASLMEQDPNANPYLVSLKVPSQKRQIDVQANSAIYAEVVKNMEIANMAVLQTRPLIQLIDQPVLPLEKASVGIVTGIACGMVLAGIFSLIGLALSLKLKSLYPQIELTNEIK